MTKSEREAVEERLRRAVRANPEMTAGALSARLGMRPAAIRKMCSRIGLPRPPDNEGLTGRGHGALARRIRRAG